MMMKYLKLSIYEFVALCIVACSVIVRLFLVSQNWPWTDSDESTFGSMALHIAYQGSHPIFMYGQFYMGSLQAYLGAIMFHLFGPSLFSLRLGLILLFSLFLCSMYLLTRTLYSRGLALVTIALLSLGSRYLLTYQLLSYGGYPETVLFGTIAFLVASWLAISSQSSLSSTRSISLRCLGYAVWGFVVGLGLWSNALILPLVAMSGLLLLLFCWRDFLRVLPLLSILISLACGLLPLIYYNLHAARGYDSLSILLRLQSGGGALKSSWESIVMHISAAVQISIPTITGNPFCPMSDVPVLRDPTSPSTLSCAILHNSWSFGYIALFACAIVLAMGAIWHSWRKRKETLEAHEIRQNLARHTARLLLLASATLAFLLYAPTTATNWPATHARYLIVLLIATPAVLWPLWRSAKTVTLQTSNYQRVRSVASTLILALIGIMYLTGTVKVFAEIPTAQAYYQQDQALIARLENVGATHVFSDYWTCNKLTFLSQEKIICGVTFANFRRANNRYPRYYDIVSADPNAAFVFNTNDYNTALKHLVAQNPSHYHVFFFEGYYIVQHDNSLDTRKLFHTA